EQKAESPDGSVEFTYDACGRVATETQRGCVIRYSYGPHGNVIRRDFDRSRAGSMYLEYDVRARLKAIRDSHKALQEFTYDARDLVKLRTMAGVQERLKYDFAGRPIWQELSGRALGRTIVRGYKYDLDGNLTAVSDSKNGSSSFAYDAGERMTASEVSNAG